MESLKTIYLVEDEKEISDIIIKYLEKEGYRVVPFYDGDIAVKEILENPPDLTVLDIMLPGMNGIEILKQIRKKGTSPVIFISARKSEVDKILGIELGADDYLGKPFSFRELMARVKSILRRLDFKNNGQFSVVSHIIRAKNLTLDLDCRIIRSNSSSSLELTVSEFELLKIMMTHPGKIFTRDELQNHLVNGERSLDSRTVDMHIKNLRKKMEDIGVPPFLIKSIRGVGYKFEE